MITNVQYELDCEFVKKQQKKVLELVFLVLEVLELHDSVEIHIFEILNL